MMTALVARVIAVVAIRRMLMGGAMIVVRLPKMGMVSVGRLVRRGAGVRVVRGACKGVHRGGHTLDGYSHQQHHHENSS